MSYRHANRVLTNLKSTVNNLIMFMISCRVLVAWERQSAGSQTKEIERRGANGQRLQVIQEETAKELPA